MNSDILGLLLPATLVLAACCVVIALRMPTALKVILCAALILRLGGAVARYLILTVGYNSVGDAIGYYIEGLRWAERYWQGDFSPFYDPIWWRNGRWWSTQFVSFPASIVTALIGPNLLGSFIIFSLLAFAGLLGFLSAFRQARPGAQLAPCAALLLLPSLWFWPSSLGKESIALLGLGLTVGGLFGREGRIRIAPLLTGFFLLAAVRSELAGIVAVSVLLAQWLSFETRVNAGAVIRGAVVAALTILVLRVASERVGIASFDVEGIATYIEDDPSRRLGGGSSIEAVSLSPLGLVMAPINVLFRPFPWEATSALQLASSLELAGFWVLVLLLRRRVLAALRLWRREPLVRLSVVFVGLYAIALGLMLTNLGVIARQRIFLFPFAFMLLQDWTRRGAFQDLTHLSPQGGEAVTVVRPGTPVHVPVA